MKKLIIFLTVFAMTISFSISNAQEKEPDPRKLAALEGILWYCADEVAKEVDDKKLYDMASLAVAIGLGNAIENKTITYLEAAKIATDVKYSGKAGDVKLDKESCEKIRKGVGLVTLIKIKELEGIETWDPQKVAVLGGAIRYCAGRVAENLDEQALYDKASMVLVNEQLKAIGNGEITWDESEAISMQVKYSGKIGDVELNKVRCERLLKGVAVVKYMEAK